MSANLTEVLGDLQPRFQQINTDLAAPPDKSIVASCEKCSNMRNAKRELGRINRQLGNLREQIEKTILSLE